ncbi:MAG: protoheme IX farnesyltransferase [Calditrichaeota bacterium]|nr:MAG: protoheme IX farnesyltransferase [Calditrichota bacterium]
MREKLKQYYELTKPGVTFLVVISTFAGFYLGTEQELNIWLLVHTLLGTFLVAGGTNALNQLIEREQDACMKRTRLRPLPSGKIKPVEAQIFSWVISIFGIFYLTFMVRPLVGGLAALTLLLYIYVYTPLKQKTTLSTFIGSVPGALPPVGGWVAAHGSIEIAAWVLFGILFFWQIPHFLAIAWLYQNDYARGGFKVLPLVDKEGTITSRHILINCMALLIVSLMPTMLGVTGFIYFLGALLLGLGFLYTGIILAKQKTYVRARQLLLASIFYLPLLLIFMTLDKIGT